MDWNNSHPQAMDGLEQCPSLTLQYNSLQNTLFTYARQTGIFLPMNAMQFSICNWRTGTFPADNNWRTGHSFPAEMKQLVASMKVSVFDQLFSSNVNLSPTNYVAMPWSG